jgi:hypothetical protein
MKLFTALAALALIAAPAQAGYVTCESTRESDGTAMNFEYAINENNSTLSETVVSTGSMKTLRAVYSASTIVAPMRIAGFSGQVQIDRSTGQFQRQLAGTNWAGSCVASEKPVQLF